MSTKGVILQPNIKSPRLIKFVNYVMKCGKRHLALKLIGNAFEIIKSKGHKSPEEVFEKAIENIMPKIEVRPKRVGGSIYQVPQEVSVKRQLALASRWILDSARSKKGITFSSALAQELIEASEEQ